MPDVHLTTEDGDVATVTLLTLCRRIADDCDFLATLSGLIRTRTAEVTLMDGRSARVRLQPEGGHHPPSEQLGLPLREYHADAQLLFELPGRVRCRASSDVEAGQLITDVVRGVRAAPAGFSVAIDGDALDTFNLRLEAALADGPHNRTLGVRDIIYQKLTERRLLEGPTS